MPEWWDGTFAAVTAPSIYALGILGAMSLSICGLLPPSLSRAMASEKCRGLIARKLQPVRGA